jgi:hypothetical protein
MSLPVKGLNLGFTEEVEDDTIHYAAARNSSGCKICSSSLAANCA